MVRRIYLLRVTLAEMRVPVWRQLVVPGGYTLDRLHRALQIAIGWKDCHLHSFEIDGRQFGVPDPDDLLETVDELDTRLDAVAVTGTRFTYVYDFGDWWEHLVTVEDVIEADPAERYPICLRGAGVCPPEDVGGVYGYERLLDALADPYHKDHDQMVDWYGDEIEVRDFDADRATALMRRMT
jgi:hypothetical protein